MYLLMYALTLITIWFMYLSYNTGKNKLSKKHVFGCLQIKASKCMKQNANYVI